MKKENTKHYRNTNHFFGAIVVKLDNEIWCWDRMHHNFWICKIEKDTLNKKLNNYE